MMINCFNIVVLFITSVMATDTCTNRYGFDVDNPGVSCADIYDNNPASHGNSVIILSKLITYLQYIVTWSWSVVGKGEAG